MAFRYTANRDENLDGVVCRTTLSVDQQGDSHDCDFILKLEIDPAGRRAVDHLRDLLDAESPKQIGVAVHCFGYAAGQGSSCGGALAWRIDRL